MSRRKNSKIVRTRSVSFHYALAFAVLFGLSLAAYWNSFHVPLVLDDFLTIQRNTSVRFGEFNWNLLSGRSVLYLTFTLNYIWTGQDVWSYHLINFLLHFLNGASVFLLALTVFRQINIQEQTSRLYALFASAFFLVHPVQTESVTYISSRSELLSTAFYLIGMLLFVRWPSRRIGFLLSCLIAVPFFFGLGSKETVISLPASIFLYDFLFLSGSQFRPMLKRWSFYLPFILGGTAASYYIVTVVLRGSVGTGLVGHLSSWHYFLTQLRVIVRYIYLVFFPVGLNLDYDFTPSTSLWDVAVITSALLHIAMLVLGWKLRKGYPVFSFSIFWFYLTLAPTSSLIPILDVIFEHRLYLPMIGVCLSFPVGLEFAYQKMRSLAAAGVRPGMTAWASPNVYACIILAVLTIGTIRRNHVWGDEVRLFQDVVSKSPRKDRAYNSLAWSHYKRADYERAIEVMQKAREVLPDKDIEFSDTLGNLFLKAGRLDEAIELFKQSLDFKDRESRALAYNNLGVSYMYKWNLLQMKRGEMSEEAFAVEREEILKPASDAFLKGLEIDPDMPSTIDALVNVSHYRGMDFPLEAKALEALQQKEDFNSLYTLGKLGFLKGQYDVAVQYFDRAEKLRSDVKLLYFNHGYALEQLGRLDDSIEKYLQSIRLDPIFIEAHHNVGRLYMMKQQYAEAIEHFDEFLRQDPKHVSSNLNLARIYAAQGNVVLARKHLSAVLEASPDNAQALTLVQQLGS